jgi:hypothetical protein
MSRRTPFLRRFLLRTYNYIRQLERDLQATKHRPLLTKKIHFLVFHITSIPDHLIVLLKSNFDPAIKMGILTLPKDEVLLLHGADQVPAIRNGLMLNTYRYNDVLDAKKLQTALFRLAEIGDWRIIGGRFRVNVILRHVEQDTAI